MSEENNNENNNQNQVGEKSNFLGLQDNIAGLLAYLVSFITGAVWFFGEKKNKFVRFHGAQSMVFGGACLVVSIVLGIITSAMTRAWIRRTLTYWSLGRPWYLGIVSGISLIFNLFWLGVSIFLMFKAYKNEEFKLPIIGDIAEKLVNK